MTAKSAPSLMTIYLTRVLSWTFRILSFVCSLLIILTLIYVGAQFLTNSNQYVAIQKINSIIVPIINEIHRYIPTNFKSHDLAPMIIIIGLFAIRSLFISIFENMKLKYHHLADQRTFVLRHTHAETETAEVSENEELSMPEESLMADESGNITEDKSGGKNRTSLLKQFIEVKRKLEEAQKALSFLSVDVIGSTKMKAQEDKAMVEYTFAEYKKFIDEILMANRVWKVAWTPDGIMCAFWASDDAVNAAREIIVGLDSFNKYINQMQTPFKVRCGINFGKVMFDISAEMEEVSDEVIDVAGHLQKFANPNSIWITEKTLALVTNKEGFKTIDTQVDEQVVAEWTNTGK